MDINLIIADDDDLIRESLKIILSSDSEINVMNTFKNGQEAYKYCTEEKVDIALLDVRMPIMNGVEATNEINKFTNTKVIILTTFDEDEYIYKAIKYGAKGYILKNNSPSKIIETIKMVNKGNSVIQEEILEKLRENIGKERKDDFDSSLFTDRELDVIKCISEGCSNKEIASELYISEGTVKNYITSILNKSGLQHRTQIAIYYIKGTI